MAKRGEKARKRLADRIKEWDEMRADGVVHRGKVKIVHGHAFRRPGSQRK